ncbi:MAG: DUF4384 domain-containing protein, partial [Desulfomonilaceae bacterium]
ALIDIGTSGQTIILFPNRMHPNNKIEKGKTYRIPPEDGDFSYKTHGPVGIEHVMAIASIDPVLSKVESLQEELRRPLKQSTEPAQNTPNTGIFLAMKDPGTVMKDIGIEFNEVDPKKWAKVELTFGITNAGPAPSTFKYQPQEQPVHPAPTTPPRN